MELSSVTVRVLGAVEMVDASGEVRDVPGRRLQALLARLVSESGQRVSVDALVDAVWPDGLPDAPDAALQTQVYRLRKRLRFPGAPTVATRGPGYALELGAATVDAIEFERGLRAAIGQNRRSPARACTTRCPCGGVRRTRGSRSIWNSARRFGEATAIIDDAAAAAGRQKVEWQHAMQVWCGIGDDPATGRAALAPAMEGMYNIPFERFERYSPCGGPDSIAEFLAPYVFAGCRTFNLLACATHLDTAVTGVSEIRRLLNAISPPDEGFELDVQPDTRE